MSDLLAHLVARTSASAPAVRARLDPFFSPAPALDEPVGQAIPRPLSPRASIADVTKTPSLSPTPPIPSPAGNLQPAMPQNELLPHREENEKPAPRPAKTSQQSLHPREIVSQKEEPALLPQAREIKTGQPQTPPVQKPPSKRDAVGEAAVPLRVKTSRHLAPTVKPAAGRFEKEQPPPAAPIVRVTIGRIEVRAAHAAAGPLRKAVQPVPPALTLEAYLNSRKGGTR